MATVAQVAALAGVGVGTVSRVITGNGPVSPQTRARVEAAIDQVGYEAPRRRGKGRRHGLVGVVIPFFDQPSSYQRIRGILHGLEQHDLEIVLYNVDSPDRARARLTQLPNDQLDALIIVSLPISADDGDRLAHAACPVVLIDTAHPELPCILVDDRAGGRMATEHILSLGHERVAFIGEPRRNPFGFVSSQRREEGYREALAHAGLESPERYRRGGPHVRSAARQIALELLSQPRPPTAIVAASDVQALGVLEAARSLGFEVGRDVSVIGYDDIEYATYSGLTTVRQLLELSGQRGADVVSTAITSDHRPAPFVDVLPLELVVRATTGPPAGVVRSTS
jgi:DNA-binding LacI/PurR family transcriptional regulator